MGSVGTLPCTRPPEDLDWRGFCKNTLQNLKRLGVRGQNLENKELAAYVAVAGSTAFALTMICLLNLRVKSVSDVTALSCGKIFWGRTGLNRQPPEKPILILHALRGPGKAVLSRPCMCSSLVKARSYTRGPGLRASFGAGVQRRRWCRSGYRGACGSSRKMRCPRGVRRIRVGAGIARRWPL